MTENARSKQLRMARELRRPQMAAGDQVIYRLGSHFPVF